MNKDKMSMGDYQEYLDNPPITPIEVIRYLENMFPQRVFTPKDVIGDVMFSSGQQSIIEYLKSMNPKYDVKGYPV